MTITAKYLQAHATTFADIIRCYVRDQREIWQRVPAYALRAATFGAKSVEINRAHKFGYWHVSPTLAVDCATGELMTFRNEDPRLATHEQLLEYAAKLDIFDANALLLKLRDLAQDKLRGLSPDQVEERREALEDARSSSRLTMKFDASMRQPLPPPSAPYTGLGED